MLRTTLQILKEIFSLFNTNEINSHVCRAETLLIAANTKIKMFFIFLFFNHVTEDVSVRSFKNCSQPIFVVNQHE